jgi:hypothetical protein
VEDNACVDISYQWSLGEMWVEDEKLFRPQTSSQLQSRRRTGFQASMGSISTTKTGTTSAVYPLLETWSGVTR